jgi:transcriptional regulator with XRE-family HTH domain
MGIEPAHVRRIEAGTANPSLAVLVSVGKAFGLSVTALLSEDGDVPNAVEIGQRPGGVSMRRREPARQRTS